MDFHRLVKMWRYRSFNKRAIMYIAAGVIVFIGLILILAISIAITRANIAPHEWNITRTMWRATVVTENSRISEDFLPVRLVIIHHTVSPECHSYRRCTRAVRRLQSYFLNHLNYDIAYNFLVGNEGRVYEGRGFGITGAHTLSFNHCSMGVAFIGNYQEGHSLSEVTPDQVKNVHLLFEEAVKQGHLHPDYHVVGGRDLISTLSPGENLYNEIQTWPEYDASEMYANKNCTEIHAIFENSDSEESKFVHT